MIFVAFDGPSNLPRKPPSRIQLSNNRKHSKHVKDKD
jgi:hypothetical protein